MSSDSNELQNLTALEKIEKTQEKLTQRELRAFEEWRRGQAIPISTSKQAELFELFLSGRSCEDIRKLNPGFSLGQIVHARLIGEWDQRLEDHRQNILNVAQSKALMAQLESIDFVSDMLRATHKRHKDKISRYLQTGDESHLKGGLEITSVDGYRKLTELLQSLTGQDKTKKVTGEVTVKHETKNAEATAEKAAKILEAILGTSDE